MAAIIVSAKVSVFYSKIKKTFPKSSQRFYLPQTLIKHKKQRLYKLFITKQEQKARNKNIAPSKVTDGRRRKGRCLLGKPQA